MSLLTATGLSPNVVGLVMVLVCLGRLMWALLVWTSHVYMLTNRRIVTIKGVINVSMFQARCGKSRTRCSTALWDNVYSAREPSGFRPPPPRGPRNRLG